MFPHFAFPLIDYKLGAHRKEFPLMLPYEYNLPPSPSPSNLYLTHVSFSSLFFVGIEK